MLVGKTVLLGVCGGIAAYKAASLCSKLTQAGAQVDVVMTRNALQFVRPLTFQAISRRPVLTDTFEENDPSRIAHIDLADRADLIVIAPATANIIAKLAHGLADDMLSTTVLASTAPVWVAPAMNVHMYEHAAVRDNLRVLTERGVRIVEPGEGPLACGYEGKGRLAEPEDLFNRIMEHFESRSAVLSLSGKKMLVTAGGTRERLDPVRYIGNDSSGKMGYAIAETAVRAGLDVTLVSAPTCLAPPHGVRLVRVESAEDMYEQVMRLAPDMDIVVKAAAVADYRPVKTEAHKIKKSADRLKLELERTPDILKTLGEMENRPFLVGFAAETERLDHHAEEKRRKKNCDLLVANDVTQEGAGFGTDTNAVRIYGKEGFIESLPLMQKSEVAGRLLTLIAERFPERGAASVREDG